MIGIIRADLSLREYHKVPTWGTRYFPDGKMFGELGVLRLRILHVRPSPCALKWSRRRAGCGKSACPVRWTETGDGTMERTETPEVFLEKLDQICLSGEPILLDVCFVVKD